MLTLCADFSTKCGEVDVVHERAFPVDLDDRQPVAIPRLECRVARDVHLPKRDATVSQHGARPLAEVAAGRVEEDDVRYG
jgi:hypothetical protein